MILKLKSIVKTKLFKASAIYTSSRLLNKVIPFLLLPILTRHLSAEDYGIVSMFGIILSILASIVGVNTNGAIARNYYDKTKQEMKNYITSTFAILIFSVSIVSSIFIIGGKYIASLVSLPLILLWIALLISMAQFITNVTLLIWQLQKKAITYGIFSFSKSTINVSLSIVLIIGLGFAWQGRIYAQLISALFFLILAIFILYKNKWIGSKVNRDDFFDALKIGAPLIPHILGAILITLIDRFFVTKYSGIAETGIYTVGYQIGSIINIFALSFNQAYTPWLYEKLKLNSLAIKKKIVKFTYIYFVVISLLAFAVTFLSNILLEYFVGVEFLNSTIFVGWIAFGYAFHGMYFISGAFIAYAKKTKYIGFITGISALINIILNIVLVPSYGAIGAAYATTIVYFIQFISSWFLSSKVYYMPWNLFKYTKEKK